MKLVAKSIFWLTVLVLKVLWSAAMSGAVVFIAGSLIIGACAWLLGAHDVRADAFALSVPLAAMSVIADMAINMFRIIVGAHQAVRAARIARITESDE